MNRVLTPMGQFLLANRFPSQGSKWYRLLKLKSTDDYTKTLSEAGFNHISLNVELGRWIMVKSYKSDCIAGL